MSRSPIPTEVRRQVIEDAGSHCGYCLAEEVLMGVALTFEHLTPVASGGLTTRDNLWRSCRPCNEFKAARTHAVDPETGETVPLFNPRLQIWTEHFTWADDYTTIIGITPTGRATVGALQFNRSLAHKARRRWRLMEWLPISESDYLG